MNKKAISYAVVSACVLVAVAAFVLWPKRYSVSQRVAQTTVFWNDHEAFVFVALNTAGRSHNPLQHRLAASRLPYLAFLPGGFADFSQQQMVAYHLASSGQLDRFTLPENTTTRGSWELAGGRLQLTPPAPLATTGNHSFSLVGTRWDGEKFVPVAATPKSTAATKTQSAKASTLHPDDLNVGEKKTPEDGGYLSKSSRQAFKDAGWHYKVLNGYESIGADATGTEATLPMVLGQNTFFLNIQKFPEPEADTARAAFSRLDSLSFGMKAIDLSGNKLASGTQAIWSQQGWRPVSKAEYQNLLAQYGHGGSGLSLRSMFWLAVLLLLVIWRLGSWLHLVFKFATMKSRVLDNMATSFSFPPATAGNFPRLDLEGLDRSTQAFEGMGLVRLLDFSLVSDSPTQPPSFGRLLTHTHNHCFVELSQVFPKGKSALPLKCSIESYLQNGWTISFSDRKPNAASSLLRRRKAIGICMPDAKPSELWEAFLKMRNQICVDLGIQPINDDTLEAFTTKMQRAAAEMREAVQQRSFVTGVPEIYLHKLSLMKAKPEYVWLGDYPKESEQRKQTFSTFAASAGKTQG